MRQHHDPCDARGPGGSGINYPVTTRVLLYDDAAHVDLELTIDKPADNWPEAGWICLPFKVDAPQFRVGRNGFIMDPAKDIIAGANRYMYAVGTGVAMLRPAGPRGRRLRSGHPAGEPRRAGLLEVRPQPMCRRNPPVYFNLFNNQWSTNYRLLERREMDLPFPHLVVRQAMTPRRP